MAKNDNKIAVLTRIRNSKDILFGQFSDTLSKAKKVEEWRKICEFCKALGLIPQGKDYSYVRDVFWSNIKRSALAKKDNANQTGSEGGRSKKITPIDDLVFDIIGKDSPILEGIGVPDTMADASAATESSDAPNTMPRPSNSQNEIVDTGNASISSQVKTSNKLLKRFITKNSTSHDEYENEKKLKKKKMELQLEYLPLQNYKMKLEIIDMERRLNISPSNFTINILRGNDSSSEDNGTQSIYCISSDNNDMNENNTQ